MKKEHTKGFISGLLLSALIFALIGSAAATVGSRTVTVDYADIKIELNGQQINPTDANGTPVEPFAINGTTYLPVRAVSSALGLDVDWDGATSTVKLTKPNSATPTPQETYNYNGEKHLIQPGQVFDKGAYITLENVEFMYDGENFAITNNRDDYVRISADIVGVKADGSYVDIMSPSFGGVDETKYNQDFAENGWAVKEFTNLVRPGETLVATMTVFDFSSLGDDYAKADIDGDGYYDLLFHIFPQKDETSIVISMNSPQSEIYKLKAD